MKSKMMSIEPRNESQMLRWFRKTAEGLPRTGGARLQQAQAGAGGPGRREPADGGRAPPGTPATQLHNGEEMKTLWAHGRNQRPRFEQVVGYLERNEPLPLDQPDRKATSFVTSHFYLDDFVQSSEDPNPRPLQHTSQAIPEDGFRTPAEATDKMSSQDCCLQDSDRPVCSLQRCLHKDCCLQNHARPVCSLQRCLYKGCCLQTSHGQPVVRNVLLPAKLRLASL